MFSPNFCLLRFVIDIEVSSFHRTTDLNYAKSADAGHVGVFKIKWSLIGRFFKHFFIEESTYSVKLESSIHKITLKL